MEFLTNSYVTLTSKNASTEETLDAKIFSGTEYLLVEVNYAAFLNQYGAQIGSTDGVLLELETYTKAVYGNYNVYDYDTNTFIGRYRFTQAGTVLFYIDTIYKAFGKVKLMLRYPTIDNELQTVKLLEKASIYVHDRTEYAKPVAVLDGIITKTEFAEGESFSDSYVKLSAIYFDNTTKYNISDFELDIERPLEVTDECIEITHAGASIKRYFKVYPSETDNKGLKSYTKQFTNNVGDIGVSANLYSLHGNMHVLFPIFTTVGYSPIDVSLIYNHQDKSTLGEFGYGYKLNYYKELEYVDSTTINVYNNDGSMDVYIFNTDRFENKELGNYISRSYDSSNLMYRYKLYNKNGDYLDYLQSNMKYPQSINLVSGEVLSFTFDSNNDILQITNSNNDVVTFVKNDESLITSIVWKHNDVILKTATITYYSSILKTVVIVNNNSEVVGNYEFVIGSNIELTDVLTGETAKLTYVGNKLRGYIKGVNTLRDELTTTITYDDYRTTVSDSLGNSTTYVFDVDGVLRYEIDSENNYISYTFDKEYNRFLEVTPQHISYISKDVNLLKGVGINNFTKSGVTVSQYDDEVYYYYSIIPTDFYKATGVGTLTYSLTNVYKLSDVYTLVVWVK